MIKKPLHEWHKTRTLWLIEWISLGADSWKIWVLWYWCSYLHTSRGWVVSCMLDFYCFHSSGPTNHFLSSEAPAHLTSAILHAGLEEGTRTVAMKSLPGRVTLLLLLAILPLGMANFVSFLFYCCGDFFIGVFWSPCFLCHSVLLSMHPQWSMKQGRTWAFFYAKRKKLFFFFSLLFHK